VTALRWRIAFLLAALPGLVNAQGSSVEGPLRNDAFLPTSGEALGHLSVGDQALADSERAGTEGRDEDAARLRNEAFEAWHESLSDKTAPGSVWVESAEAAERRTTEGRLAAVWRRLTTLSAAQRGFWRGRFEPLAAAEFDPTSTVPGALEGVSRRHPGTLAAVRAALIGGDRAFERGRIERARLFWKRARREAGWIGEDAAELLRALARRAALTETPVATHRRESWRTATALVQRGWAFLPDRQSFLAAHRVPPTNAGSRPGLVFLDANRIAVQTTSRVHILRYDAARKQLEHETAFEPAELLPTFQPRLDVHMLGRREPGWVNAPAFHDGDLFLVQGRADHGPNALFCLRPPSGKETGVLRPTAEDYFASLRWAIVGAERIDAAGVAREIPGLAELAESGRLELQPGPVVVGDLVLVQARELATDTRAWMLAFDRVSGELVWKYLLAQGADLVPSIGRIGTGIQSRLSAQPLLAFDDVAFAGTHLGAGVLLDVLDGRPVWSFKNRRKDVGARGWDGRRPVPLLGSERGAGSERAFFWAPVDSDRLYLLRAQGLQGPDVAASIHAGWMRPLHDAEILLGGSIETVVLQGRAGAEETVKEWRSPGTDAIEALYLGPDEQFQGRGLATPERVYACSDRGLYLFDRSRELYLLEYAPLESGRGFTVGGDLYARGSLVLALSRDGLWAFEAR